jgi:ribA/ribD-fused uncharacterized protein
MTIRFYATRDAYGCFSNFSAHPFELDGLIWPTSEHYFQASKFEDAARREEIRAEVSPMVAARMGRSRNHPLRADWETVKDDVMRRAVLRKFETHPDIAEVLLGTGDEEIVEATTDDHYWGCGTSGTGRNMLGIILMEVRAALRARAEGRP